MSGGQPPGCGSHRPGCPVGSTHGVEHGAAHAGGGIGAEGNAASPVVPAGGLDEPQLTGLAELGPVDILVNNAARAFYELAQGISEKRFRISLELNFIAPFDLMQRVIPGMRDRKRGWLLNISSTTAASPPGPPYDDFAMHRGVATYASNKAALDRMSAGLAAELHEFGIAVNSLSPVAAVLTDAAAALGVIPDDSPTEPVEVMAEAALALCSGDPAILTGRITTSGDLLAELGRPARTLDGKSVL